MKRIILAGLLLLFTIPAFGLDKCYSGSYFNPTKSGEGFDLQISEETIVVYFFGYEGSQNTWLLGAGENIAGDEIILEAYQTENFEGEVLYSKTGTMTLFTWEDPTKLTISWNFQYDFARLRQEGVTMPWCLTGICQGDKEVTALFRPTACD